MIVAREVIGVDIGEVLVEQRPNDTERWFRGPNFLESPEMPDAFRVLKRLRQERFEEIRLITRCGRALRAKRVAWLDHHDFYQRVGIPRELPHYCWSPQNKSNACHDLGVTHFVDDNPREMIYLSDIVPHLILFRPTRFVDEYAGFIKKCTTRVESWTEIEKLLLT